SAASEARANQIRESKSIANAGVHPPAEPIEDFRAKFGLDAAHNEDGSITIDPEKPAPSSESVPPMAGGSTNMATWVNANPTLPEKVKNTALALPRVMAKLAEPFKHAGPDVEKSAQGLAGEYESSATAG